MAFTSILLFGLLLSIPAFYLLLAQESGEVRMIGHLLYGLVALILLIDTVWQWHLHRRHQTKHGKLIPT